MAELESNPELEEQHARTASELLVAARQKSGLSQKEVADQLFLTTAFIRYIDEGTFHKISKPAFIRGYLRSYARVVQASGDEIVGRYDSKLQEVEENIHIRGVTEETVGSANFTGPVLQTGLIGLVGVVLVVGLVWWLVSSSDDEEVAVPTVVISQPEPADQADPSEPADFEFTFQEQAQAQQAVEAAPELIEDVAVDEPMEETLIDSAQGEVTNEPDPAIDLAGKAISIERNSDAGINYITLDAGGFDEIEMTFSGECWLEIEDGDGESIYGDLNKAGDVLRVYGVAPFRMLLGRAPAVTLLFNGSEIDVARYTSTDKTAKIRLTR